jgi:hypothetical protein
MGSLEIAARECDLPRRPMLHRSIDSTILIYIAIVNLQPAASARLCCIAATEIPSSFGGSGPESGSDHQFSAISNLAIFPH